MTGRVTTRSLCEQPRHTGTVNRSGDSLQEETELEIKDECRTRVHHRVKWVSFVRCWMAGGGYNYNQ